MIFVYFMLLAQRFKWNHATFLENFALGTSKSVYFFPQKSHLEEYSTLLSRFSNLGDQIILSFSFLSSFLNLQIIG